MDRFEHLAWAKQRALECLDRGDLKSAVASMTSDLRKHPDYQNFATDVMCSLGVMQIHRGAAKVREWIEAFE